MEPIDALGVFRDSLQRCFDRRVDALFELGDAILTAGAVPSPVHLSLTNHRIAARGWGSLQQGALDRRGRIDAATLRRLLSPALRSPSPPAEAKTSADLRRGGERVASLRCGEQPRAWGYYYHPSRHSAAQPLVAGWAQQWIARLGFARESWTAPVDVVRLRPTQNTDAIAAAQVKALLDRLPTEEAAPLVPLFVFDAGY